MTPKERAAMQQALEALENERAHMTANWDNIVKAITALREALAEQAEQEPVAWWNGKETVWFEHELITDGPVGECKIPLYASPQPANKLKEIEMTTNNEQNLDLEYKAQMFEALLQAGVEQLPVFKTAIALFNCEEPFDFEQVERDPVTKRLQQQVDYWINHYDRKSPADMELLRKDVAKFAEDAFAASGKPIAEQRIPSHVHIIKQMEIIPEQEPVAWRWPSHNGYLYAETHFDGEDGQPVYAAPVRTKDLTDDEIDEIPFNRVSDDPLLEYARAVIAAYKEKNK